MKPHTQDWFVAVINDIPTDDEDDELLDIIERAAAQMRAIMEETE